MQVASRPRLNAGIALVGASVIAVCPLAPPMPDMHLPSVHSAAVELAALANPIDQWAQVIQTAVANLGALGQQVSADPAPILQQILANQRADAAVLGNAGAAAGAALTTAAQALPAALHTAATQLAAGNVTAAVAALTGPVLPLAIGLIDAGFTGADAWQVVVNTTQNFANVVATVPDLALPTLLAVAAPVISVINANTAVAQAVVDAARVGDLEGVASALINDPATVTGAFLNGFGTLPLLGTPVGGLLSGPGALAPFTAGTIAGLLSLRDIIAKALEPQAAVKALASPAALPATGVTAVALTTAPATKAIEASAPKAAKDATDTSAAAKESSATDASATDGTIRPSTSSTDATDSSTSSAASSKGDTTTKGDPADSTTASGSSSTGDTSTKGATGSSSTGHTSTKGATGTKSGSDTKGGSHAKGDGGAKKSGDTGSKSGSNSKGSGGGGRHRK